MSFNFSFECVVYLQLTGRTFYDLVAEHSICDYGVYLQQQLVNSVFEKSSEMFL